MFSRSMPKASTFFTLVDIATKCFEMCRGSFAWDKNQPLAEKALAIVSWVVKVFEAIMKSVVSGSSGFRVSAR